MKTDITKLIEGSVVDLYDSTPALAEAMRAQGANRVTLYARKGHRPGSPEGFPIREYRAASVAGGSAADVCFLDGSALKVLAVRYPGDPRYILARLRPRLSWVLGGAGLLRRLFLGRVKLRGVAVLRDARKRRTYWLVITRAHQTAEQKRLFLPKSIGVVAFLEWLRNEKIQYVVLRFYDRLPALHREDGDLDLLVSDEDTPKVEAYLRQHAHLVAGTVADGVPIGLHTVSLGKGVPYYPPPLARQILANAIDGPAGSRIPSPKDAFLSFVYHALYHHKGYATNIPSALEGKAEHPPENDYGAVIKRMATEQGIAVGETMEELDEYLAQEGWRPRRDTLAKIAEKNAWVRDRFFAEGGQGSSGLAVFILKENVLERGLTDGIVNHLRQGGLNILRVVTLSPEAKRRASDHVRGGNWTDAQGNDKGLLPAAIVVAIDPQCAHLPPAYASQFERVQVKKRKEQLRRAFDQPAEPSLVHSADNTQESWDYIEICVPEEAEAIRAEVERAVHAPFLTRMKRFLSPTYALHALRFAVRDVITKRFL